MTALSGKNRKKNLAPRLSGGEIARAARAAADSVALATTAQKNAALQNFIEQLQNQTKNILAANKRDLAAADGISDALKDRLGLDEKRLRAVAEGLAAVIALPDPVGEMSDFVVRPSGISVGKMRTPLGVILAIYESRPNVTADIAALALKAGNAVILRGGSEAKNSNFAIGECLAAALDSAGLPREAAQVLSDSSREVVGELLACEEIALAIPRGGRGLIERVSAEARMPVLKHLDGNCHIYVDNNADLAMAEKVVVNAKTRRFGVCSAAESLLVHAKVAAKFLPQIGAAFLSRKVEMRGCRQTRKILPDCKTATADDWRTEYLAPIISVKIVADASAAISHINEFGSGHTDAVITDSFIVGRRFLREVDSSSVMWNASTAFADGGEYGLGAEVGISTDKLHARGPVGLAGLTSQKYVVLGEGQVRD